MYWTIFLYVLMGWLIFHLRSIKKYNESTPQLKFLPSIKCYFEKDPWGFIISVIALIFFSNMLNLGMSGMLSAILGIPQEFQSPNLQRYVAFTVGINIQFLVSSFTKSDQVKMDLNNVNPQDLKKPDPTIPPQG